MPEHRIRLRGAWDWLVLEGEAETARRVTLPTIWPPESSSVFRLVRRFGRPPFDPSTEFVRLELLGVPGLVEIQLNGREIGRPAQGAIDWSVPLDGPMLARNSLVLEVDLDSFDGPVPADLWGSIALVIGSSDAREN